MQDRLQSIIQSATHLFERMFMIAMYIGVLLSLFAIHRYFLLGDGGLASHIGFSFLNGFALAKVILVGQELRIGDNFRNKPLIYVIGFKSAIFAVLLLIFRILEETIIGLVEGRGVHEALMSAPLGLEHNRLLGMTLVCIIMFFSLMPFFAYLEFEQVIGAKELRGLLFGGADAAADPTPAPTRQLLGAPAAESAADHKKEALEKEALAPASRTQTRETVEPPEDVWFYEQAGEVIGPVDGSELKRLLRQGAIRPQTLVYSASRGDQWLTLNESLLI